MGQHRNRAALLASMISLLGATGVFAAAPTPADMMAFRPKQPGVIISTPADAELASCKVELVNGPGSASGWALKDAKGQMIRKFVASKGARASIDVWSYYLEGNEVYREIDSNDNKKPDQYRWFGAGGMRWGVDVNEDGRIDGWKMISAEEVSQEVLKAIATKDVGRFQALLINEAEIKALELPANEAQKIAQSVSQAPAKFQQTMQALSQLNEKTQWLQLSVQPPQCVPAEQTGGKIDLVHYTNAALLYQNADKTDGITIGDMIQVGRAWRLVTGPVPGQPSSVTPGGPDIATIPDSLKPFIEELQKIDVAAPKPGESGVAIVRYNLARAAVLEKIAAAVQGKEKEQWVKQLADCLSAAVQSSAPGEKAAQIKLAGLRDMIEKQQPGSPLAGYVVFRDMSAEYSSKIQLVKGEELAKLQDAWRENLKQFVQKYSTAEDAPDAALQLGMVSEFMGKETEAKEWYGKLAQSYAQHPYAKKGQGALKRIESEGKPFELAGPTVDGGNFSIAQHQGKTVIVYYWASWSGQYASDFSKINELAKKFADKGIAIVTVNLDDGIAQAKEAIAKAPLPAVHLHTPGGLDSKLATDYGVMVLPNLFLVGKDGKVISRTVQMSTLEDEIKKATDK